MSEVTNQYNLPHQWSLTTRRRELTQLRTVNKLLWQKAPAKHQFFPCTREHRLFQSAFNVYKLNVKRG